MAFPATKPTPASGLVRRRNGYVPPRDRHVYPFPDLLKRIGRAPLENRQLEFLALTDSSSIPANSICSRPPLYLLSAPVKRPTPAGSAQPSLPENSRERESRLSAASPKASTLRPLLAAVSHRGRVAAVIGTPVIVGNSIRLASEVESGDALC
jgi:hypothetical protein